MAMKHTPIKAVGVECSGTNPIPTMPADEYANFKGFADWEVAADTGTQKSLWSLFRQRDQVNQKIVRVQDALLAARNQVSLAQLKTFTKNIDAAYSEFSGFHSKVMAIIPDEAAQTQEDIYRDFEDRFNFVSTTIEELMQAHTTSMIDVQQNTARANQPTVVIQQQPLRVPLPTFDGQYRNWPKFKAIFQDLMRTSTDSNAVKLYHLEKSLIGDASGIIDASTIRDNNYEHAWRILENRFDNKRLIVDTHILGIKKLKQMTRKCSKELRDLIDECTRHVEGLRFMDQELLGVSELLVVNILTSALDKDTRESWEKTLTKDELPSYNNTIEFLQNQYLVLERCEAASFLSGSKLTQQKSSMPLKNLARTSNAATSSTEFTCELCSGNHLNYKCSVLQNMTIHERIEKIKSMNACYNCLRKGHRVDTCPSERTCSKCLKKHHTLLHMDQSHTADQITRGSGQYTSFLQHNNTSPKIVEHPVNTSSCSSISKMTKQVLLLTATVNVLDKDGHPHTCRALLDSGSQVNFLTESMAKILNVKCHSASIPVVGIGGAKSIIRKKTVVTVRSNYCNFSAHMECLITTRVTGLVPSTKIDVSHWSIPSRMQLADPCFDTPAKIDLLIGAELFFEIIMQGKLRLCDDLPLLQETVFGWVVTGTYEQQRPEITSNVATTEDISQGLQRFWEIEDVGPNSSYTTEKEEVEEHFQRTHRRDKTGRFIVQLPFRETVIDLDNNRSLALRRFMLLEKKLIRQPDIKRQYCSFIEEFLALGHCKEIDEGQDPSDMQAYYLPHHAVLKPSSTTTKLRVVFDGTAKLSQFSLNDVLKDGPTVQSDIFTIILRFRKHRYAFTADICKMYRQVRIDDNQTRFQRIFWRESPSEPLKVLELTTVTYGTAPAAYLATRSLKQLAEDGRDEFPVASDIVINDFYVDDILSGAETITEAVNLQGELQELLAQGGFPLRKWCSNSPAVLRNVPPEDREIYTTFDEPSTYESIKTLGILWDPIPDNFRFVTHDANLDKPVTKRYVLSEIARLFDPLGLVSPVLVLAKMLMQRIWISNIDWDDKLDSVLLREWIIFRDSLAEISRLRIPRCVVEPNLTRMEFHGFADASNKAYGACVYLRCVTSDGSITVRLLCSKSKIAPLTEMTIPRKELCAALLLARLMEKVSTAMKLSIDDIWLWSDSQIVLCWLKKPTHQLEVFQRNRVTEINRLTNQCKWRYIRTEHNPADVVSRGQFPAALKQNRLWWEGPDFLRLENFVIETSDIPDENLPGIKGHVVAVVSVTIQSLQVFEKFNDFRKLQRVIAYVLRFSRNLRTQSSERIRTRFVTIPEMKRSLECIVRVVQRIAFSSEISSVIKGEIPNRLAQLWPIIDERGLLRVGGRLQNSILPYDAKHQLLLPKDHPVTESLIRTLHIENLHIGSSGLLAVLRQKFWLTNAKSAVKKIIRNCVICFKANPRGVQQLMGSLPQDRVVSTLPFEITGVDYAGPIIVKEGRYKPKHVKSYIALFVCLTTKNIHLELVTDLSADAFLASLDRFVNRRGLVKKLISDNATNFTGAAHELKQLYSLLKEESTQSSIVEFLQPKEIEWSFIPPRAPNFGGLWEAGVKSVKNHLKRTLQSAVLTFEELYTVLTHIEAILNSRPLYTHSGDPNDPLPITPAHLQLGKPLEPVPKPSYLNVQPNRLSRWQYINLLRDHFWKRWSKEYLSTLQTRGKWFKKHPNLQPNMIVIVAEDNTPAQTWKVGKITAIYPGKDSVVRVADVKTSSGVYRRATSKLVPLPILDNEMVQLMENNYILPGENVRAET